MPNTSASIIKTGYKILLLLLSVILLGACAQPEEGQVFSLLYATPTPAQKTVYSGDLILPIAGDPDPINDRSPWNRSFLRLIYDTPIQLDHTGKPAAALATHWTTEGGAEWIFTLRPNVTFHDGSALGAADIVRSYQTLRGSEAYRDALSAITSMEAKEDGTLLVRAKTPGYHVLYAMVFPVLGRGESKGLPVGSGAWKIASRIPEGEWELERNDSWYRKLSEFHSIKGVPVPSEDDALGALSMNQISVAPIFQQLSPTVIQGAGARHIAITTRQYEFLAPNLSSPILGRREVREAIASAIDVQTVITQRLEGQATEAELPVLPDSWLSEASVAQHYFQTDHAHQVLAEAGWVRGADGIYRLPSRAQDAPLGGTLTLSFRLLANEDPLSPTRRESARLIADMLRQVGFQVELVLLGWEDYQKAMTDGDFDLALAGINLDRTGDLSPLLATGGERNIMKHSSAETDALLATFAAAPSAEAAQAASAGLQRAIARDLPIIGLYFRTGILAYTPELVMESPVASSQDALYYRLETWTLQR